MSRLGRLFSGEAVRDGVVSQGWWLVVDDGGTPFRVVAGPYARRSEVRWALAAQEAVQEDVEQLRPVYGVRRADGTLSRRPSPEDWAWLDHLGDQLDRLPEDWDTGLSDDDPLGTLVVELTAALAETGLPLHDADGELGGVCLTPEPGLGGIVVTWRQHDRMSVDQVHGPHADAAVQQIMNRSLADVLHFRGFAVEPFGQSSGSMVRAGS